MDKWELSWEQVSFISPQGFAAVYLPFTTSTIDLIFNESTKVSYDYWILYDNFWWKELQKVNGEIINDSSEENLKKSLVYKRNENFLFEQEINGQKRISIDTKKTFTTNQNVGYIDSIKNSFLTKWKNPKGAIIMLMGKGSNEKIVITRE